MKKSKKQNPEVLRPWIRIYDNANVPHHLEYPNYSMIDLMTKTIDQYPHYTAYEFFGASCTFEHFYEKIVEAAKALKINGVSANDKVAICMPNTPQAIILFYAINMVGAIAVMIHPLSAENEIDWYLNETNSTMLLTIDLAYKKVCNVLEKTPVKKVIITSISDDLGVLKSFIMKIALRGKTPKHIVKNEDIMTWKEFINLGYDYDGPFYSKRGSLDPAAILFSGGTTGNPKGILLSNLNFNAIAMQVDPLTPFVRPGDSILAILPIFHGFGLAVNLHTAMYLGIKAILIPDFKPNKFADLIKKHKPNFIIGVPTLFEALIKSNLGKEDLKCVTTMVVGGDFTTSTLKNKVEAFVKTHGGNAKLTIGYGLTEATAATCASFIGEYRDGSIGVPFPDTYYKIVRIGTHDESPTGEDGEICISGPTVMMGYINNVKETMQTLRLHEDGKLWLHTGDIGCLDEEGRVYFKQRLKRLIISSGYNIYPSYIEDVINNYPGVLTSTVIGIPDPYKIQVAKAFVVLEDGKEPNKEFIKGLKEHCKKNLALYSVPKEFEFKESLPHTLVGKVAYTKLEENNDKK